MAYEGEPGIAAWALLGPTVELRRTPYDVEAAVELLRLAYERARIALAVRDAQRPIR